MRLARRLGRPTGPQGEVDGTVRFRTAPVLRRGAPHAHRAATACRPSSSAAWPCRFPPILPSLNQIGFDSYDMVVGAVAASKPDRDGARAPCCSGRCPPSAAPEGCPWPTAAARSPSRSPGRYRNDSVIVSQSGLSLTFSFGDVPFRRFDLRMQLDRDLRARFGAALYAEVYCPDVPVYGPAFVAIGLCNDEKLAPRERHVRHPPLPAERARQPPPARRERGSPRPAPADAHRGG